jgi:tetratricopeptide (TPR) repeat protein
VKRRRRDQSQTPRSTTGAGRGPASPATRPAAPPSPAPLAPAPPLARDPWAWLSALAVLPLVLHSLGAPLGEPVADDFDFLHHALFSPTHSLFDGGGSTAFWRPLAHQLYFGVMSGVMLSHPGLIAALHTLLLALAAVLLYRALRRVWPGPWAALAATFPLFSESTRSMISWPAQFVDLGAWLFTALAIHQTAARRLWSTLLALLAALLCKEVAVVAALLVPWLPGLGPRERGERLRWAGASAGLVIAWGATYLVVRGHAGLVLPHPAENAAAAAATPLMARVVWAISRSLKALFSLPTIHAVRAEPIIVAAISLFALALGAALVSASARARLRRALPLAGWGLAWFAMASATMTPVYPIWAPYRSAYGGIGFGVMSAALLGAAHPALLASLVALRLVAFALSPGPPARVGGQAPETGAFIDFERLVRLQRLMHDTRVVLKRNNPSLPRGAGVGLYYLPRHSDYAYGGSRSLQVWYRDSTLHWVTYSTFTNRPETPMAAIAEYERRRSPQMSIVDPEAMRSFLAALANVRARDFRAGLAMLDRADSIQHGSSSDMFAGQVAGKRAEALTFLHEYDSAEREARRGIALWPENSYAHYALAVGAYVRGQLPEALALVDSVLAFDPRQMAALELHSTIVRLLQAADSVRVRGP